MVVLVIALSITLGLSIGIPIGKYIIKCEFGRVLHLLEASGQLKVKVTSDEKDSE